MNLLKSNNPIIFNIILFILVMMSGYFEIVLMYIIALVGLSFNIYLVFKRISFGSFSRSLEGDRYANPNLSERNMIMEDLDREVTRRREVEKLNKN